MCLTDGCFAVKSKICVVAKFQPKIFVIFCCINLKLHWGFYRSFISTKPTTHNQCWSTRVQYSYSSTTREPFFEYSYSEPQVLGWYSYSKVNVLGTRSKKAPSTRVHLVFAKSNKQNEFLIVNCSQ